MSFATAFELKFLLSGVWAPPVAEGYGKLPSVAPIIGDPRELLSFDPYLTRVFMFKLGPIAPSTSDDIWVLTVDRGGSESERDEVPFPPAIVDFL
jgi:hypothetical protein